MNDVFTPDAFKLRALTAAINKLPYQPTRIAQLGIFEEQGIATLDVAIEESQGTLSLLDVKPRNAPGKEISELPRTLRSFRVPHIPEAATIMADEVQGVRQFGSDNQAEVLQTRISERLTQMRVNMDYTMEAHRVSAIKGLLVNHNNGTTDLFAEFGVTQQTHAMTLHATNSSKFREQLFEVRKKVRAGLGAVPHSGMRVLCGDDFWKALLEDKDVKATYLNQLQAAELRGSVTDSVDIGGATFEWYEGDSSVNFGSDAYVVPQGVRGLFLTRFAPANYNETVNTIGLPYYAKGAPLKMDKGWEMEAQSNPLNICTRPKAIVKLTIS